MHIKKVWAVFFSATGTTRKVVTEIASVIAEKLGTEYDAYDFTLPGARTKTIKMNGDDLVVFGTPVYAGRVPNVLLKYLATIEGNAALAVPVVVYGNRNYDDALIELRDILEENKFHTIAAAAFIGEHSFSRILAKERPDGSDMKQIHKFALNLVEKVQGISEVNMEEPISVTGFSKPYRGYYQPRDRKGNSVDIRKVTPFTNSDCNDCRVCVNLCPMGSIYQENVKELIGICIKCGACVKGCPMHAKSFEDTAFLYHQHELEEGLTLRAEPEIFI